MPLNYKIETFEDSLKFNVRGQEIQLSLIAAGALCNAIAEALLKHKQPFLQKTSYYFWLNKLTKASNLTIPDDEAKELKEYLHKVCPTQRKKRECHRRDNRSHIPIDNTKDNRMATPTISPEFTHGRKKNVRVSEEERKRKLAAQIKEMRERFNIK